VAVSLVAGGYQAEEAQVAAGKVKRPSEPAQFFTEEEQNQIISCVQEAEKATTAEILVRLERKCGEDPIERCRKLMDELGITRTKERTGILIYCSIEDHRVAIFGDEAIHAIVGTEGWKDACEKLASRFANGDFVDAICDAIHSMMPMLKENFPAYVVNPNELPDKPSFGE